MSREKEHCSTFNLDLSETVSYNNPLFPVYVRHGFLSSYPDYAAISHWHEDLEFIYIKKGNMTYNVNGELIPLTDNNGIMVNSRQLHYGFSEERQECEFICILFSTELLAGSQWFFQNYVERVTRNAAYPYLFLEKTGWQALILEKLKELYCVYEKSDKAAVYFEAIEAFLLIMKLLYENLPAERMDSLQKSAELESLKNMIAYLEEHYTEHITLENIAFAGACCKSKCSVLFKKYLSDTPMVYTTKLRLRKSLVALLDSDRSITEISYAYGFGGASYYCEMFQKYYRESPLQYRKKRKV